MFWNESCIEGSKKHIKDNSIDLIITDPPFAIQGDKLHKHYNRDESKVIDGYVEIPKEQYPEFSRDWIQQAQRILKPGGSLYVVSGWTNLKDILIALDETELEQVNHLIWKYNFGVYTKRKYVSSHYHILYCVKPGKKSTFNTYCRFNKDERENGRSLNYKDLEDVWIINREYKQGEVKNKNQLPSALLRKMIEYSSNPGDMVCDMFSGSFSTAKMAIELDREACGFEINKKAFEYQMTQI